MMTGPNTNIDRISSNFPSIRLKYGVERRNEKLSDPSDDLFRVSLDMIEPWEGILNTNDSSDASTGLVKFQRGDILLSKLRPYLAKAFIASQSGAGSPELLVLKPKIFDQKYLLYLLLSTEFVDRVDASTMGASLPRASWQFIGDLEVPNPRIKKQERIANYLDKRTEEIDRTVTVCETLLEKLDTRKDTDIVEQLTENGRVGAMDRDSQSQLVPENWNSTALKWISDVIDTKHRTAKYVDSGVPIISPSEVSEVGLDIQNANRTTQEEYCDLIEDGRRPRPGDIIYSRNASVGDAALVRSDEKICMGQDLCLIRSDIGEYLYHVLNSPIVKSQVEAMTVGATFNRINVSDIKEITVPIPPEHRIDSVTNCLSRNRKIIQKSKSRLKSLIEILKERRRLIISRAVTGKIDLTGWNAPDN